MEGGREGGRERERKRERRTKKREIKVITRTNKHAEVSYCIHANTDNTVTHFPEKSLTTPGQSYLDCTKERLL